MRSIERLQDQFWSVFFKYILLGFVVLQSYVKTEKREM